MVIRTEEDNIYKPIEQLIKEKPEIYMEAKNWWRHCKHEVMKAPENAHLRRERRSSGE